ncbi:hypothetical protein U9M49_21165 [Cytobacillus sp. OWB-43]|uniref:hypothetical protein n=1 Tax=Cytobacillus sp. OWB-43 TaxID=3108468 RepID=UPI002B00056C|nr:hypothetical protein [Cytobacillus sp. OWB-43]MEA1855576.1 hypothetical protein [Cytobacillus sp. OWB-43]
MSNRFRKVFGSVKVEMNQLEKEYQEMKKINTAFSKNNKDSIEEKFSDFNKEKKKRNEIFNIIRNK